MKIGIFDSGVAGLVAARDLCHVLAGHEVIYLGDSAGFPYGIKSPATIAPRLENGLAWLVDQGVDAIGIVCGGAAAVYAAGLVRQRAIVSADTVTAAVPEAASASRSGRIGVLSSAAVIQTGVFRRLVPEPGAVVIEAAAPLLGPLVLAGWLRRPETRRIVKKTLYPLKRQQIDTLIIASGAGSVLAGLIREKIGARVRVVDAAQALVRRMTKDLNLTAEPFTPNPSASGGRVTCWLTDTAGQFAAMAQKIFKGRLEVRQAPGL